jgi:DNA-directed RNA polymerase subunit RPC12/RpoP
MCHQPQKVRKKCIKCGAEFDEVEPEDDYDYIPLCADCTLELKLQHRCKDYWNGS